MSDLIIIAGTLVVIYTLDELTPYVKKTKTKVDDVILNVLKKSVQPIANLFKKRK